MITQLCMYANLLLLKSIEILLIEGHMSQFSIFHILPYTRNIVSGKARLLAERHKTMEKVVAGLDEISSTTKAYALPAIYVYCCLPFTFSFSGHREA